MTDSLANTITLKPSDDSWDTKHHVMEETNPASRKDLLTNNPRTPEQSKLSENPGHGTGSEAAAEAGEDGERPAGGEEGAALAEVRARAGPERISQTNFPCVTFCDWCDLCATGFAGSYMM